MDELDVRQKMKTRLRDHLDSIAAHAKYGPITPAPCRGFVILAVPGSDESFDVHRFPIVGVVIREMPMVSFTGHHREVIPVYLSACYAHDVSGGMNILEEGSGWSAIYYSVVWCEWPEEEDDSRIKSVEDHVAAEARLELKRDRRG